ncbi:Lipid A biosynthesis palmitoleoyltransferase [Candidatus Erwinia haradaeae]|uniref:Lipid A biosynthesis acyltransferase n=1 Tax=Candidatus Erwinia haradaeae TaxID=1922217 RepID=A0A451DD88_9GAMM|nr:kdo(2)-lipid IV(A) palmitoleoyltransferase [Candidatus Erwinia haradaeae]VFP84371.1 Lipid A biosynthesis palmitoleoyltransferase [Candidatus Erwinia haradaeae]
MQRASNFDRELMLPRYWITWFGISILFLIVCLPYPLLYRFGIWIGRCSMFFMKRRVFIVRRNLELCFPDMDKTHLAQSVKSNFESLGMGLLETGMAWFWSDRRVKKWFSVKGLEHLIAAHKPNRGILMIGLHFMSLELGGRAMGLCHPMTAIYRPHNNKLMEWVQTKGRLRSNKAMINRRNLRGAIHALKSGEIVWFAPDQDYGAKGTVFAPLFSVPDVATTSGTWVLARLAQPALMTVVFLRKEDQSGYELLIEREIQDYPLDDEMQAARYINNIIEKEIMRAPSQYMWLHRRFKTRPAGMHSLY